MPSLTISLLGVRGGEVAFPRSCFICALLLPYRSCSSLVRNVRSCLAPSELPRSDWVSETLVDPTSGFAKGGGYEKGTWAQRGARQGQAYYGGLMMMMNMCLRKPDDSSGRDLHLNLAPTADLHERNEAALFPASAPPPR